MDSKDIQLTWTRHENSTHTVINNLKYIELLLLIDEICDGYLSFLKFDGICNGAMLPHADNCVTNRRRCSANGAIVQRRSEGERV